MRRYTVFNAAQIDGIPALPDWAPATEFATIARAESVLAALKETGLLLINGGSQACYVPARDEIHMPARRAFHSVYDYYATLLREGAHSTLHPKLLDRQEALGKRWATKLLAKRSFTRKSAQRSQPRRLASP